MTTEELLMPRYKVIGPFPHMNCKVGDIIDFSDGYSTKQLTRTPYDDPWGETLYATHGFDEFEIKDYPNLFQPLPWYAEREPGDVEGLYIKCKNGEAGQIKKHYPTDECKEPYPYFKFDEEDEIGHYYWNMNPEIITLEEYEQWKQSKNK